MNVLSSCKNLVTSILFIPLSNSGVLVHVLNNVAPTDSVVVGTERNLTFLGAVRNDAHFGAAKIVVEKILKPHTRDEEEVPAIRASPSDVLFRSRAIDLAVVFSSQAKRLVKLFEELVKAELGGRVV